MDSNVEHYFVSSWVPHANDSNQIIYYISSNQDAVIGFKAPVITIQPNSEETTSAILYVGPKDQDVLETIAPNLDLTIDYGFLWMISKAIILVTYTNSITCF